MSRLNSPAPTRRSLEVFWLGMVGSVVMLGVALIVISQVLPRQPLSDEMDTIMKGLALGGLIPFFVFRRIYSGRVITGGRPAEPAQENQRGMVRLTVGASLAELPLMVMLAYVAIGGPVIWGILAWVATFAMILTIRPETGRVV